MSGRPAAILGEALDRHEAGDLDGARARYEAVIEEAAPGTTEHADALQYLGILLHQAGDGTAARRRLLEAAAMAPGSAAIRSNLATVLLEQGDVDGAIVEFEASLERDPGDPDTRFGIGGAYERQGDFPRAVTAFNSALAIRPGDAACYYGLGNALTGLGQIEQALGAYREATTLDPQMVEAWRRLGMSLRSLGLPVEAVLAYQRALDLDPRHGPTHNNLGGALRDLGELQAAISHFRRARTLDPGLAIAELNLGRSLATAGDTADALLALRRCRAIAPETPGLLVALANVLRFVVPEPGDRELADDVLACLRCDRLDPQELARVGARVLRLERGWGEVSDLPGSEGLAARLSIDPFWRTLLARVYNVDPVVEHAIAGARAGLLEVVLGSGVARDGPGDDVAMAALALHGFAAEYVSAESAAEGTRVAELVARLEGRSRSWRPTEGGLDPVDEHVLLAVSMYRSLASLPFADALERIPADAWSEVARTVVRRSLLEPREERRLAERIGRIGLIEDAVSNAVREQYEANPYPRWIGVPLPEPSSVAALLGRRFPGNAFPPSADGPAAVLVAGCGTGREAIEVALACDDAAVVAVDLSRASLAYGQREARRRDIGRIEFMQGDILSLGSLGRRFRLIVCTGVLHHMADPEAGAEVLAGLLSPGGVLRVALYSERGRAAVVAAREAIAREGLRPELADIRRMRALVLGREAPEGLRPLAASDDFYTTSSCRDLMFHAHETRFDLPRVERLLSRCGLVALGLEAPDAAVAGRYREAFPDDPRMADLGSWHRFEQAWPDTFQGMYHLWCQRPEGSM